MKYVHQDIMMLAFIVNFTFHLFQPLGERRITFDMRPLNTLLHLLLSSRLWSQKKNKINAEKKKLETCSYHHCYILPEYLGYLQLLRFSHFFSIFSTANSVALHLTNWPCSLSCHEKSFYLLLISTKFSHDESA